MEEKPKRGNGVSLDHIPKQKKLFVCGTARSGTTALARLLSTHPNIVMGMERFKYRFMRHSDEVDYGKLFDRKRFFQYDPADTNISLENWAKYYDPLRNKFDSAIYVGDKIPSLYKRLGFVRKTYPDCKVIYIVRDPVMVAMSWERRARTIEDTWPKENNYVRAIEEWNRSLCFAAQAEEILGNDIIYLCYERTFISRKNTVLRDLLRQLELDNPWSKATHRFLRMSSERATVERCIPSKVRDYVEQHADYRVCMKLLTLAL